MSRMVPVGHIEVSSDSEDGAIAFAKEMLGEDRYARQVTRVEAMGKSRDGDRIYRFYIRDLRGV